MNGPACVAITRPVGRGRSLALLLRSLGLEPLEIPLIEVRVTDELGPLRTALRNDPTLVILSSATSVSALVAAGGVPAGLAVAAVGPATAAALAEAGIRATVIGDGSGGAELAERIGAPGASGDRAVVLAAADGLRELIAGLVAHGWEIEEVVVYATVPRILSPQERGALDGCDVICFASPSAVAAFTALRDARGHPLRTRPAVVIGATTARAARSSGFAVVVADTATDEAMARAVTEAVSAARGS